MNERERQIKRLFVENWRAKLMSLIVATAVWYLIRKNVDEMPDRWRLERLAPVLAPDRLPTSPDSR